MFPLRHVSQQVARRFPVCRPISTTSPLVDVTDSDGIVILTMQRLPVNALNLELLQAMNKSFDDITKNKPRGMILTSASSTVFSAGLDITEMSKVDPKRMELFWTTLQDTWLKLFGFKYATAAAINGHAPAGGCLLAMSCEHRAMVSGKGKYTIGLNESALGIVASSWFMDSMCHIIAKRDAEVALTTGRLFTAEDALKVGLIDEIATDKADALEKCKTFISRFDKIPAFARTTAKLLFRGEVLRRLQENRQQDLADHIQAVNNPEMAKTLESYMRILKEKSGKQKAK